MNVDRGFLSLLVVLSLSISGCASFCGAEKKREQVLKRQSKILKEIVQVRSEEGFKARLQVDPVLVEQEQILTTGLAGIIQSQDELLLKQEQPHTCGGQRE